MPAAGTRPGEAAGIDFRPVVSPGIQLLRRLSQAAARISLLRKMIRSFYLNGPGHALLRERETGKTVHAASWVLHFEVAVSQPLRKGVGEIFSQTCQIVMLQLLETSKQQIEARQKNLTAYAPLFREILIQRLSDIGTLTRLRDQLRADEVAQQIHSGLDSPADTMLAATLPQWTIAAKALADACRSRKTERSTGAAFEIVRDGEEARIRDEQGFLWTRTALERAIAERRGQAESMDPLIQQLADIPEVVESFRRNPDSAESLLRDKLDEMLRLNGEKQREAKADLRFGLRAGRISENARTNPVPGLLYDLGGVHLIAHEQIHPFFREERDCYTEGVSHIFSVELGIRGIAQFFVFTGLVALAVFCAPAAFIVGTAVAGHEVHSARERRALYRALINPELVLNRVEVEIECYIAYVGLALSLLPEAGTAARALSAGVRGAARGGAATGLRLASRSVVRHVNRQITEQLSREMLPALLRELTVNLLMDQVIVPQMLGPLIAEVERELRHRTSVGGIAGATHLIEQIEAEAARRAAAPLPTEIASAGGQ